MRRALAIDENIPDALVALGRVHEKNNDVEQAKQCYEKAVKQPVTNINAYFYLGIIHEKKKDYKISI